MPRRAFLLSLFNSLPQYKVAVILMILFVFFAGSWIIDPITHAHFQETLTVARDGDLFLNF
jgi:hypothetical protein